MQGVYENAPLEGYDRVAGVNLRNSTPSEISRRRGANVYADLSRELDAVSRLFGQWERDCEIKRRESMRTVPFPDFPAALTVFNYRGERRVGTGGAITVQDYFFCSRRRVSAPGSSALQPSLTAALARAEADACSRCARPLPRHSEFFVDSAKRRSEADCLCRPCVVAVARSVLGFDDAAVLAEAARLREARWAPMLRPDLADELLRGRRTFFS